MLHGRPGLLRTAAGAVVGASCLAATACGGLTAATLRASSVADPLAGQAGSKVMAEATANAEAAASLTINGTVSQSGKGITIDLGIKRGQGCAGTVGISGVGSMKLVVIGATLYMKPDAEFWKVGRRERQQRVGRHRATRRQVSQASGERRQRGGDRRRL